MGGCPGSFKTEKNILPTFLGGFFLFVLALCTKWCRSLRRLEVGTSHTIFPGELGFAGREGYSPRGQEGGEKRAVMREGCLLLVSPAPCSRLTHIL